MDHFQEPLPESSVELDLILPTQDPEREDHSDHSGSSLDERNLVPSPPLFLIAKTIENMSPLTPHTLDNTKPTNRSYARGQRLFILWRITNEVSLSHFTATDMVNFFTSPEISHYGVNTLQLFRTAIRRLHHHPASLTNDDGLRDLFQILKRATPPLLMSQPMVDLFPTFTYLSKIISASTTLLLSLSRKTAFLLAMSALLRPSDLHHIVLNKCSIDGQQRLHLVISAPKGTRDGRRIIKSPILHPHRSNDPFCPVLAFSTLWDHPSTTGRPTESLFVSAKNPSIPVTVATISTWLRTLAQMSTSITTCPSIRSLASDLAIQNGVPLDDVVFMGN
ncbi:hypothetical protein CLU79DRAFT_719128 [Phycomyces nitens]|nr:hypothetical protein CLU79DRAFT_719128 [Phycomyces nitens]